MGYHERPSLVVPGDPQRERASGRRSVKLEAKRIQRLIMAREMLD